MTRGTSEEGKGTLDVWKCPATPKSEREKLPVIQFYRVVLKKGTVLLSTSLAWPAVAGCSRAETFSQLSAISLLDPVRDGHEYRVV